MVLFKEFSEKYLNNLKKDYILKKHNIKTNSEKVVFFHNENNTFLSLKNILEKKEILKSSLTQNEINSISKMTENNYLIFHTSTMTNILNHNLNIYAEQILEDNIINQYNEFSKYFRQIFLNNKNKNLDYKNVRIYELTKKLNLHCHKIDFLKNNFDFIKYIESLYLSRNKTNIGRVELVIDIDYFKDVENYFKNNQVKIRIKNKTINLTLTKKQYTNNILYIIKESKKGNGNFIYIRTIEKQNQNDKDNITKYLFKYMLKGFDNNNNNISKETLIFSKLKLKQKVYSKNFFNKELNKDELEKLNNKIFTYINRMENNKITPLNFLQKEDLETISQNKNKLFYTLSSFLTDNKFFITDGEKILEKEYIKIKEIILDNIDKFSLEKKKDFFYLVFNTYIDKENKWDYTRTLQKHNLKSVNKYIENKKFNDLINKNTIDITQELIEETFRLMKEYFNFKNTNKQINYFNEDLKEIITIYEFKTDYEYYKFLHLIESKYQLLTTDLNFRNTDEKIKTFADLINILNDFLYIDLRFSLDQLKEEYKEEQEECLNLEKVKIKNKINEEIENHLINSNKYENEFKKGLLNYYNTLSNTEKENYYNEQDLFIQNILKGE